MTVFEKSDRIGGLLRYGIPDFKMEKHLIDRRIEQMEAEGVTFRPGVEIGAGAITVDALLDDHDAVVLAGGAEWPRDLPMPGRELDGVHFAMDFLTQQNKRGAGDSEAHAAPHGTISADGQTCRRHRRRRHRLRLHRHGVSSGRGVGDATRDPAEAAGSREQGADLARLAAEAAQLARARGRLPSRDWAVLTKRAAGSNGQIEALECARIEWVKGDDGRMQMREVPGGEFSLKADLVLLAMGFLGPRRPGMLEQAGLALDPRGNVAANTVDYRTSMDKVFAAGDMRRGQSLVVWAIREGRQCARAVDAFLMGSSLLPA